ncbi:hypothetical protein GWK47_048955 [Chionoecetes opilio]|uniref:Uncharacterized protein n=1 Tax=Chionoecetes opilio TaxID=41210 RepID=A0A8J4Y463_CHIOP|nr:hypothetical protein GWK47_048955 [Chionoecetes opilio]
MTFSLPMIVPLRFNDNSRLFAPSSPRMKKHVCSFTVTYVGTGQSSRNLRDMIFFCDGARRDRFGGGDAITSCSSAKRTRSKTRFKGGLSFCERFDFPRAARLPSSSLRCCVRVSFPPRPDPYHPSSPACPASFELQGIMVLLDRDLGHGVACATSNNFSGKPRNWLGFPQLFPVVRDFYFFNPCTLRSKRRTFLRISHGSMVGIFALED